MNILTWIMAGAGAGYLLLLAWRLIRRDPVQDEADRGVGELEEYLKQQKTA